MTGSFGATPAERGFRFRVWAPAAQSVQLHVFMDKAGQICVLDLSRAVFSVRDPTASSVGDPARVSPAEGVWETVVSGARHGDRYAFSLDGRDPLPDPASRFQPDGVHAWSAIVDPRVFAWTDSAWHGLDPRRAVIYELHVGTFTPTGTFRTAIERLPCLRALGVTAIELMPLADFPGSRNWGYDGVALFAPARAYGPPRICGRWWMRHTATGSRSSSTSLQPSGPGGRLSANLQPVLFHRRARNPGARP